MFDFRFNPMVTIQNLTFASILYREKVTRMSQNTLDSNSTNLEVTDTEILEFYNLATMTLLRSLEVKNLHMYLVLEIHSSQFRIIYRNSANSFRP